MQTEIICQIQSVKGAPSVQETLNGIDAKKILHVAWRAAHERGSYILHLCIKPKLYIPGTLNTDLMYLLCVKIMKR